jgi:hypothetical protein
MGVRNDTRVVISMGVVKIMGVLYGTGVRHVIGMTTITPVVICMGVIMVIGVGYCIGAI